MGLPPGSSGTSGWAFIDKLTRLLGTAIDDTVRLADEPERLLHQLIGEMTDDLVAAKNHLAGCKQEERRLAKRLELMEQSGSEWEQRATSAMRAGDDIVAKDALARKHQHEEQAAAIREARRRLLRDANDLKNALVGLNLRIEEVKHRKNAILLRAKRAHAENAIREIVLETPRSAASAVLDRLDRKISLLEGEAGLLPELSDDVIASRASATESAVRVEAELLRLKRPMTKAERKPKKPLAKTGAATRARASPRDRPSVAGQKRTKR